MRIKTIFIIIVTILFTVVLMQNTGTVPFTILFGTFYLSKLVMLLMVSVIAFILGWLAGRPKRVKRLGGDYTGTDVEKSNPGTLSNEDKDYLN